MTRLVATLALIAAACSTSPGPSSPNTPGDCASQTTQQACADTPGCRYLTPGCAEGDETALPEAATGCYRDTPCSADSCTGACTTVIVNPCLPGPDGVACDACGEQLSVCLAD